MDTNRPSTLLTASATILAALFLLAAPRPTRPAGSRSQSAARHKLGLSEQHMQGGYWRADHTFQPALILTNILENEALTVTPVLYAADGTEYDLPPVTLGPAGVTSIDIRQSLNAAPDDLRAHFSDHGSAGVKYSWQWAGAVDAMVQNRDAKRSLNFNFCLRAQAGMQHAASVVVQEGLWWKADEGVTGFLGLINVSPRAIQAQVQVLTESGEVESERRVELEAHETQVLDLLKDSHGRSGGVRVTYAATGRDLVLAGGLENAEEGYHAQIPFTTIQEAQSPSAIAVSSVGLMLGTPDARLKFPSGTQFGVYLALRNTTEQPIMVSPTLYWMEGAEARTIPLRGLALGANQAKYFDTEDLSKLLGLPAFSGIVNLVFSYQGSPSDVLIANGSIAQTKKYDSQAITRAVGKSQAIGLKDWDLWNGNDTLISLLNLGDNDQDLAITFFFDGGRYRLPVELESGGSTMVNVSDIIGMQQPDPDGHLIPPGTLHGSAVLSGASGYPEWINVGVSVAVINVSTATCGTKCPTCFGYSDFQVQGVNSTAPVGGTATFKALALGQNGVWTDVTRGNPANGVIVVWSSDNSNVATSQGAGAFTGVSSGGFDAIANATLLDENPDCPEGYNQPCPSSPYFGSAGGTITPPTASVTLTFTGSKSTGDNLSFGAASYDCSESLGLHNCSNTSVWLWNMEGKAVVSDDASKWSVSQSYTGRKKGLYKDSNGHLQSFDISLSVPNDNPSSSFVQQPSGQNIIFWLDAPGHSYSLPGFGLIDSMTQVQNFVTLVCSKTVAGDCSTVSWYFKLMVGPGAQLDTANSQAGLGSASTNF